MYFSIIIPIYNRPEELNELLHSLLNQTYKQNFEIVIIEDGSTIDSKEIVQKFENLLDIKYFFKENTGPGDSRNYGMHKANGDYFIIFDSDCVIPNEYLKIVSNNLDKEFVDCFGGPDEAAKNFTNIQKAINFSMTAILTTGGVRGGSEKTSRFQPRSFNMGISKLAFQKSGGFGTIHPGEDPDLSIRLWKLGFDTKLFTTAFVYHKRRIDWKKFYIQVNKFGKARPILNKRYPEYSKLIYFFPTMFIIGLILSVLILYLKFKLFIILYAIYFLSIFLESLIKNKNIKIAVLSVYATFIQFYGYGIGFLKSFIFIQILNKNPETIFPELFFNKKS